MSLAKDYDMVDWLQFDASVVRGLSYYTGIVFEGFDKSGELRAICGGGRYDKLLESMGGEPLPAVGFGFGDAVIVELLKMKGTLPDTTQGSVEVVVFPMSDDVRGNAVAAATALRSDGLKVDLVLENKKPKWAFQRADRIGAGTPRTASFCFFFFLLEPTTLVFSQALSSSSEQTKRHEVKSW